MSDPIQPPVRSVYRVNYYLKGMPATAFVCAYSDSEAASFIGVRDGSAQVNRVAGPVEVSGIDQAHAPLASLPVSVAPFDLPKVVSVADFQALQAQIEALGKQIAAKVSPDQPAASGTNPEKE